MAGGAPTNEAIDSNDPPAIFFHGDQDRTVPFEWAAQQRRRRCTTPGSSPCSGCSRARVTASGWTTEISEQSDYFLYYAMDLANAAR